MEMKPLPRRYRFLSSNFGCRLSAPKPEAGTILIVTIWTLVILSLLGVAVATRISSEIRLAKYLEERLLSLHLAKAAYREASLERAKDTTPDYDTIYELQRKRSGELVRGVFIYQMSDEESKVNMNTASKEIIARLPGLNSELAEAIIDSTFRPFVVKEELLLVECIDEELYSQCEDLITVYGEGKVNINTASGEVLRVLGLDDDLVEIISRFRKGDDGEEGTEDDRIFEDVGGILNDLRSFTILSHEEELQMIELLTKNLLAVRSENLKLNILTEVSGQPIKAFAIICKKGSGTFFKIRHWQER